jgi:hypothetical protein
VICYVEATVLLRPAPISPVALVAGWLFALEMHAVPTNPRTIWPTEGTLNGTIYPGRCHALKPVPQGPNTMQCPGCKEHFDSVQLIGLGVDSGGRKHTCYCSLECADKEDP